MLEKHEDWNDHPTWERGRDVMGIWSKSAWTYIYTHMQLHVRDSWTLQKRTIDFVCLMSHGPSSSITVHCLDFYIHVIIDLSLVARSICNFTTFAQIYGLLGTSYNDASSYQFPHRPTFITIIKLYIYTGYSCSQNFIFIIFKCNTWVAVLGPKTKVMVFNRFYLHVLKQT